jgi:hypothetical protein
MKLFDELTEETFLLFAARHYYNPKCIDADEFFEDIKRFKYIKRLINRYFESGNLSVNLLLNHIVVVFNVFDIGPGLKLLEYKFDKKYWTVIKPIIIFLKVVPNDKYTDIAMDKNVINELRKI